MRALILTICCGCGGKSNTAQPDAEAAMPDAPPPITPDDPGPADVRVTIDSTRNVHPISRFIYGSNQPDWMNDAALYTLARSGGNRLTAYNWENNASNAGTDYLNQNDGFLSASNVPGKVVSDAISAAHSHAAAQLVTVPIQGYV